MEVIIVPIYQYKCEECEFIDERLEFGEEIEAPHPCPKCNKEMERIMPTTMNFRLRSNNKTDICGWSDSGYETNRYWEDVNKERAKGKDVQPTKL